MTIAGAMLFYSKTQILVIVFVHVVCSEMDSEETKGEAKKSFVSLLKNIVDVNEKRLVAMKKLENLQDFMTKNTLSKIHGYDFGEDDTAEDLIDQHAVLTLIDMRNNLNLTLRRTFNKQEATNNNINIIIPSNSYNIKAEYKNDENNRIGNINDNDGNANHNKNNVNDKIKTVNNRNYKINNSSFKMGEANIENDKIDLNSHKMEYANKENDEIDYGYNEDLKIYNRKDDSYVIDNSRGHDDQKYTTNEENNEKENRIGDDADTIYRKNWRGASCDKRAAKVCKKACVDAHKNGCMLYKCSRRAKKAFSKECKRSCKEKFLSGRYSDSDWD